MSKKARPRMRVLERVKMSIITLIETAPLMGLSYRQAPRILNVLEGGFLEDLNRRFAIAPPEAQDAHVKISK